MSSLCRCGHSGWDHYLLRGECDKRKRCGCFAFKVGYQGMTRIFETDGNYVPPKPYHLGSSEEDFESNLGDFDLDFHLAFYEKSGWAVFSFVWICSEYNGNLSYGLLPDPNSKLWSDSKQECLDFVAGIASTKLSDQTIRCFVEGKLEQEWTGKK